MELSAVGGDGGVLPDNVVVVLDVDQVEAWTHKSRPALESSYKEADMGIGN